MAFATPAIQIKKKRKFQSSAAHALHATDADAPGVPMRARKGSMEQHEGDGADAAAAASVDDETMAASVATPTPTPSTATAKRRRRKQKARGDDHTANSARKEEKEEEEEKKKAVKGAPSLSRDQRKFVNRQRTLILAKAGVSVHHRHLMADLLLLLPHGKKEAKYGSKSSRDYTQINDLCEMRKCPNTLFFESYSSGGKELYMYAARSPQGPTIKFKVSNIATMKELKMTGNALKGSRPVMHFDAAFDSQPLLRLMKEMFTQIFATPQGHPKSKPFVDHVFGFFVLDGKIWFRNYQIVDRTPVGEKMSLVEIGPRFVLDPVRVLDGCFEGDVLYNNDQFVSLRDKLRTRADEHKNKAMESLRRKKEYVEHMNTTQTDPVKLVWHEKDDDDDEDEEEDGDYEGDAMMMDDREEDDDEEDSEE